MYHWPILATMLRSFGLPAHNNFSIIYLSNLLTLSMSLMKLFRETRSVHYIIYLLSYYKQCSWLLNLYFNVSLMQCDNSSRWWSFLKPYTLTLSTIFSFLCQNPKAIMIYCS
jgi:hypothetical protein